MPTYTYSCKKCGHQFDVFHSISATPKIRCEACNSTQTQRNIGTGAGLIFKGSGFYETDFKGKKGTKPESKSETKTETKTETKSEPKKDTSAKAGCGSGCACH